MHKRIDRWQEDTLAIAGLALAVLGTYWRIAAGQGYFPAAGGDLASFLYPTYRLAADALRHGTFLLWNPWLYGGAPHVADIQAGFLYPVNLLLFFLWPHFSYAAMEWLSLFHLWWAGAGLYLYLRQLQSRRGAALLAALAWMLSDFFVIHLGNLNLIAVMAWLPWLLLTYERGVRREQVVWAAGSGLLLGIAILAGHAQAMLFLFLALAADAILLSWEKWQRTETWPAMLKPWGYLLLTSLLGTGLAAPVLLPAFSIIPYTARAHFSYLQAIDYSLHPLQWIGLLLPGFFQNRLPATSWGPWPRVEAGYIGLIVLLLAATGLRWPAGKAATRRRRLGATLTALGFGLALGGDAVWQGWLYWLVPGFNHLRAPARFVVLGDFGLALLAANGAVWLLSCWRKSASSAFIRWRRVITLTLPAILAVTLPLAYFALLTSQDKDPVIFQRIAVATNSLAFAALLIALWIALLWLRPPRPRRWFTFALLLLVFFDLSTAANVDIGAKDPAATFSHQAIVSFLQSDQSLFRIDTDTGINDVWAPDTAALYQLQDIGGIYNPLALTYYSRFRSQAHRSSRLYNFLNVKYILLHKKDTVPGGFVPVNDSDPHLTVYLNQHTLPRAQLIYKAHLAPNNEAVWEVLADPNFDPAQEVVLANARPRPLGDATGSRLDISSYKANTVTFQVKLASPAYLVISDVWYPGWRVWVNGKERLLLRANGAFRAIYLPAGEQLVEMKFQPHGWRLGWLLSAISVLIFAGIALRDRRRAA